MLFIVGYDEAEVWEILRFAEYIQKLQKSAASWR